MRRLLAALLIALASVVPDPTGAQTPPQEVIAEPSSTIRPGDVVRLRIWREPTMSGEFSVDQSGRVVFPGIGEVNALNETPESLHTSLLAQYQVFLRNPSIEIFVLRRVQVRGSVRAAGLFTVDLTTSISDVIALAGGAAPDGSRDKVRLFRGNQMIETNLDGRTTIGESIIQSGDQLFIPQRSWFSRNSGVIAGGTLSVIVALILRR